MTSRTNKKISLYIALACVLGVTAFAVSVFLVFNKIRKNKSANFISSTVTHVGKSKQGRIHYSSPYQEKMLDFFSMVSQAKNIFPLDTTSKGKRESLTKLKDIGIYYWNRNLEVLAEVKAFDLDTTETKKIRLLEEYCLLNRDLYNLMYKAIDERSHRYDAEMNRCATAIAHKTTEIKKL